MLHRLINYNKILEAEQLGIPAEHEGVIDSANETENTEVTLDSDKPAETHHSPVAQTRSIKSFDDFVGEGKKHSISDI